MYSRRIFTLATALFLTYVLPGQYYDTGQDPARLKWLQIKTDRFRVVYPENYGTNGIAFARALDKAYSDLGSLFPEKKFRIPVIIHNHTTQSNGYVAWAPRRMEIFPTPEQNSIPLDASRQLALHELTHVIQMASLNRGFTRALSYAVGEQATGLAAALLPLWYLEGDAVFAETVLSGSGRGRSPDFQKQLKAIVVEKGRPYKFDKMILESYRDYIPDHYRFGYQMTAWARTHDMQIWNKTIDLTGRKPYLIIPVNLSLKKNENLTKKRLYYQAFDTLSALWKHDIEMSRAHEYEAHNLRGNERFLNYYSPAAAGKDSLVVIRTSLKNIPEIILLRPSMKIEKRLHIPGNIYPFFISAGGGKTVWVETHPDLRWENRNYSVIKIMDLKTGRVRQLTRRSRYMAASLSPDGRLIAASENSSGNTNSLVIIEAAGGNVADRISSPVNASLQRPQWSADGTKITVIYLTEDGEGIMSYSVIEKKWHTHISPGRVDLQASSLRNDTLFFVSSINGTENIFMQTPAGEQVQMTNSRFGSSDLTLAGHDVFFCDYTSSGSNICSVSLKNLRQSALPAFKPVSYLSERFEISNSDRQEKPDAAYSPVRYSKWKNLFSVHSWLPFYADLDEVQSDPASIRPGATVMTQNHLSTLTATAGYEYSEDQRHLFHSRITWKGWFPVFETQFHFGEEASIYNARANGTAAPAPSVLYNGRRITNTIYLPFYTSTGKFSQFLYVAGIHKFNNDYIWINESSLYTSGTTQLMGRFYFNNSRKQALRDIYPRWAQNLDIVYSWYPFESDYFGSALSARSSFYFPGILSNHSLRLRLEAENQTTPYIFYHQGNRVSFSRSYDNVSSREVRFVSAEYFMPLCYPDFNISSLFYLKRLRAGLFYDYTRGRGNYIRIFEDGAYSTEYRENTEEFKSFGIQMLSDFYLLRIPYMISAGVQTTFRSFDESPYIKLLFNIDIYGMKIGRRPHL